MPTITSDTPSFAAEMKVKGTFLPAGDGHWLTSKYLFLSKEDERKFFADNPRMQGTVDLEAPPPRGRRG